MDMNESASVKKVRNPSLDVLRITAFFIVVCHHFSYASDYTDLVIGGKKLFVMTCVRAVTVCCVPLFIMLTGYLQTNKKLSGQRYRKNGSDEPFFDLAQVNTSRRFEFRFS